MTVLCFVSSLKVAAGAIVVSECELHGDISIGKCNAVSIGLDGR